MFFCVNDIVTRKSYNNDTIFIIDKIQQNKAILKGYNIRLCADCFLDDLNRYELIREKERVDDLPIKSGNFLNGKVLHLDSDIDYLKRSMQLY